MKLKGKVLSAFIAGTLAVTSFGGVIPNVIPEVGQSVQVSAAGESLWLSSAEGVPGETVTLSVNITCNNNFESLDATVNWEDTSLISAQAQSIGDVVEDSTGKEGSCSVASDAGSGYCTVVAYGSTSDGTVIALPDGPVATIDFTIPKDAEPGTIYNISLGTVRTFAIFKGDNVASSVPVSGGTITVIAPEPEPTEPAPTETEPTAEPVPERSEKMYDEASGLYYVMKNDDGDDKYDSIELSSGDYKDLVSLEIPSEIEGLPVRDIESLTFENAKKLESVTIPDSMYKIPYMAFERCESLKNITIPDSVTLIESYAFSNCTSLESITLPESLTYIKNEVFVSCTNLKSIQIPDNVWYIGEGVFRGCTNLKKITLPNGLNKIENTTFDNCSSLSSITLPENLAEVEFGAFGNCTALAEINIPDSLTAIADSAFRGCTGIKRFTVGKNNENYCDIDGDLYTKDKTKLISYACGKTAKSFTVPDSVTEICSNAFKDCGLLTSVTIPDSVEKLGQYAFEGCKKLTSINIPGSVKEIVSDTFRDCESLKEVTLNEGIASIGSNIFSGCMSLETIVLPDSLEKMGSSVFSDCTSLKSVTLPKGIKTITGSMFSGCESLKSLTIPDTVTEIGNYAFNKSGLTEIKIPASVTKIGVRAFGDCPNLKKVSLPSTKIEMEGYEFCYCPSLESITVDEKNPDLYSIDGNLYSKDKKMLLQYAIGRKDKNFTVPDTVETIGGAAFADCKNLKTVKLPDGLKKIEDHAFNQAEALEEIIIPDSVTEIKSGAFQLCKSLTAVKLSNSLTTIEGGDDFYISNGVFAYCTSLKSITIPEGVTTIEQRAFYNCSSLEEITLPKSLTSISGGYFSFEGCTALKTITILNPKLLPEGMMAMDLLYSGSFDDNGNPKSDPSTITLRGYADSTVPAYAERCGYKFEVIEDEPAVTTTSVTTAPSTTTSTTVSTTVVTTTEPQTTEPDDNVIAGDANGDNTLNVRDAAFIAAKLAQGKASDLPDSADFNGDGKVNVRDAAAIAKFLATGKK